MPTERERLLFVLGTRPEAIKLAPLILRAKADQRFEVFVCSTGQHREMLTPVLEFFGIRPDDDLQLMKPGQRLVDIVQGALQGLDQVVPRRAPHSIIVQGDTTTAFVAGLYGFYNKISVYHVEAGLRSGDLESPYPEEFNRRALALASDLHFAPTEPSAQNLSNEGISRDSIIVTGNTGIDALLAVKDKIAADKNLRISLEAQFPYLNAAKKLILVTLHRRENFGAPMREVAVAIKNLSHRDDLQILVSAHLNPNVRAIYGDVFGQRALWSGQATAETTLVLSEPFDYISFVYLMTRAHLILTDSGGIQEEAPSLGKPVLVARTNTERAEALAAGNSKLVELSSAAIESSVISLLENNAAYSAMAQVRNPFGDGRACERILEAIAARSDLR